MKKDVVVSVGIYKWETMSEEFKKIAIGQGFDSENAGIISVKMVIRIMMTKEKMEG